MQHLVIISRILVAEIAKISPRLSVPERDFNMGLRTRINNTAFNVNILIEPTEYSEEVASAFAAVIKNGTLQKAYFAQFQLNKVPVPLIFGTLTPPTVLRDYSEFGSYARFGTEVTSASIFNRTQLVGRIANQDFTSPSTVRVYFSVNGQQFSLQPVQFFYYTVRKITPFGVPFKNKYQIGTILKDPFEWTMCPNFDGTGVCAYGGDGTITSGLNPLATIRVYGNNFRSNLVQVADPIYTTPMCKYGNAADDSPGIIGQGLVQSDFGDLIVPGSVNYKEGYVECSQPTALSFTAPPTRAEPTRKIRVEVALNGRDFSFSLLTAGGAMGLILYEEPQIFNSLTHGMTSWSTLVAPIDGGLPIRFRGTGFNALASTSDPPTCFCIFPTTGSIATSEPWMKMPCKVLSSSEAECLTPPFASQGYGYASLSFQEPPRFFRPAITLNDFHWHIPINDDFSFFDVKQVCIWVPLCFCIERTGGTRISAYLSQRISVYLSHRIFASFSYPERRTRLTSSALPLR